MSKVNLEEAERVEEGDEFDCPRCGGVHELRHNSNDPEGTLIFVCEGDTTLAALNNEPISIDDE